LWTQAVIPRYIEKPHLFDILQDDLANSKNTGIALWLNKLFRFILIVLTVFNDQMFSDLIILYWLTFIWQVGNLQLLTYWWRTAEWRHQFMCCVFNYKNKTFLFILVVNVSKCKFDERTQRSEMSRYLSLYVSACRSAMRFDVRDPASWTELAASLVAARHAMICCVCGRLLKSPTGPAQSTCHHYYCRTCVGGKTRYMKGGCGWCKDTTDFVADCHLESVVRCFRQLCVYLKSFIGPVAKNGHEMETVVAIVQEAAEKCEDNDGVPLTLSLSPADQQSHAVSSLATVTSSNVSNISQDARPRLSKSYSVIRNSSGKHKRKNQSADRHRRHHKPDTQTYLSPARATVGLCLLTNAQRNVADLQLSNSLMDTVTWSDNVAHSHLPDVDQHIDVEETLVGGIYDTQWPLLENPVLAEHDYNKLTTSFNTVTTVPASTLDAGSPSKLPRSPATKKPSCKKSPVDKGTTIRKHSLTIRQLSEGTGNSTGASTAIGIKVVDDSIDGSLPRRQKSAVPKVKIGCRCALATPAPGKLTCCGQRCPCYAAFHGCSPSCKCRGCRNPRGDPVKSPVIGTTVKSPSADQMQRHLPLFDPADAVFGSVSKDHIVVHSPTRFTAESVGC